MPHSTREQSAELLARLCDRDPVAVALVARHAKDTSIFSTVVNNEVVPLFRVRAAPGGLLFLDVRRRSRWQRTPEAGGVDDLAELLVGPLRLVWFLDAEDGLATSGNL